MKLFKETRPQTHPAQSDIRMWDFDGSRKVNHPSMPDTAQWDFDGSGKMNNANPNISGDKEA